MEHVHGESAGDGGAAALLVAVIELSGLGGEPTDVHGPLRLLAERSADLLDVPLSLAMVQCADTDRLSVVAAEPGAALAAWLLAKQDAGPWRACMSAADVVWFDDPAGAALWQEFGRRALLAGVTSGVAVPILVEGAAVGAVVGMRTDDRRCSQAGVDGTRAVAAVVGAHLRSQRVLRDAMVRAEQLQGALDSRVEIEQAKGMLAGLLGIDPAAAFQLLRNHARRNNMSLASVVSAVIRREIAARAFVSEGGAGQPSRAVEPGA